MRRLLVTIAAAGTALAFATPAAAQYFPQPAYGAQYGNPYGNRYGNGYGNSYGPVRYQREIQAIRLQMNELHRAGRLTRSEAWDLDNDIRSAERSIYWSSRDGLSPWEARNLDGRIWNLRNELRRYSDYDGRRWGNNGYNRDRDYDRDHDRRDDRDDRDRD
jgi:hypothetical protein